ncbi:hypothetical protein J4Q44_G00333180 [Coregonus suidteri]|uniref:Uncharacterized protein n=1 Tax=Coregonus suidteri TaxID=861788 RepID=A0AAN8KUK0_9TELE
MCSILYIRESEVGLVVIIYPTLCDKWIWDSSLQPGLSYTAFGLVGGAIRHSGCSLKCAHSSPRRCVWYVICYVADSRAPKVTAHQR